MKKGNIFGSAEYLDPDLIEEAEAYRKKKNAWVRWGAAAACLCLIAAGAVSLLRPPAEHVAGGGARLGDAGGASYDGEEMAKYKSIAVLPDTQSKDGIEKAELIPLSEAEVLSCDLAAHLPKTLPEGFHFGRASLYVTVMQDGTQYRMLSVNYITGVIPESERSEDGGEVIPEPGLEGDGFLIRVTDFAPLSQETPLAPQEAATDAFAQGNRIYLRVGECYAMVFPETAEPAAVLEAARTME